MRSTQRWAVHAAASAHVQRSAREDLLQFRDESPASLLVGLLAQVRKLGLLARVMKNGDVARLQLAWLGFNIAEYGFVVALGVYAYAAGGAFGVGLVGLIRTLPAVLSGPLISVVSDRWRRERVLALGLVSRAAATAGIIAALAADAPAWAVYCLAAVDAAVAASFYPALAALLPDLAREPDDLAAANATTGFTENVGTLIGPFAAGLILVWFGTIAVFITGAGLFLLAAASLLPVSTDRKAPPDAAGFLEEITGGFRLIRRERDIALVVGLWGLESLLLGAFDVLVVVVAIDFVGLGQSGVGFLVAAAGLGGLIGSAALAGTTGPLRFGRILGVSLALFGLSLMVTGVFRLAAVAAIAATVAGFAGSQIDVSAQTLLQRIVSEDKLARVLGAFEGMYWGALGVGGMLTSLLVIGAGIRVALIVCGVVLVVSWAAARGALARTDRDLEVPQRRIELLRRSPMFDLLPIPTVEHLARSMVAELASAGDVIIHQGADDERLYVIDDGFVHVEADGVRVATLGEGDVFGEIAALRNTRRTASVIAATDVGLLSLDGRVFYGAVTGYAGSEEAAMGVAIGRLAQTRRRRTGGR